MAFDSRKARAGRDGGEMLWFGALTFATLSLSYYFACATPFAALATIAALRMTRGAGLALMAVAWAANQAVGYGLLHYPATPDTILWGIAIGVAAGGAFIAAQSAAHRLTGDLSRRAGAFALAFAAFEGGLYLAQFPLGASDDAFSLSVVAYVLVANALALLVLSALEAAGRKTGIVPSAQTSAA